MKFNKYNLDYIRISHISKVALWNSEMESTIHAKFLQKKKFNKYNLDYMLKNFDT